MKRKWVDPDDAPVLTGQELKSPTTRWRIRGKIVAPQAGRAAFKTALRAKKTRINIHIDDDVIAYYKQKAGPRGYQTLINSALRLSMASDIPGGPQQAGDLASALQRLANDVSQIMRQLGAAPWSNANGSWHVQNSSPETLRTSVVGSNLFKNGTISYNS
jgi:uncharacterized protein (DUF4415 family)